MLFSAMLGKVEENEAGPSVLVAEQRPTTDADLLLSLAVTAAEHARNVERKRTFASASFRPKAGSVVNKCSRTCGNGSRRVVVVGTSSRLYAPPPPVSKQSVGLYRGHAANSSVLQPQDSENAARNSATTKRDGASPIVDQTGAIKRARNDASSDGSRQGSPNEHTRDAYFSKSDDSNGSRQQIISPSSSDEGQPTERVSAEVLRLAKSIIDSSCQPPYYSALPPHYRDPAQQHAYFMPGYPPLPYGYSAAGAFPSGTFYSRVGHPFPPFTQPTPPPVDYIHVARPDRAHQANQMSQGKDHTDLSAGDPILIPNFGRCVPSENPTSKNIGYVLLLCVPYPCLIRHCPIFPDKPLDCAFCVR
jgi:hypothetical protein